MKKRQKTADELDKADILAWVGGGSSKYETFQHWKLTEEQQAFFPKRKGVIHLGKPFLRWTKWELTQEGWIEWRPFSTMYLEEVLKDPEMEIYEEEDYPQISSIYTFLEQNPEFTVLADLTIRNKRL